MYAATQTKTKFASLALAALIALGINGSLVWEFDQMADEPTPTAALVAPSGTASSFEI